MTSASLPSRDQGRGRPDSLRLALILSAVLHVAAGAAIVFYHRDAPERPPAYRIEIIGAAGMRKQAGVVAQQPDVAPAPAKAAAPKAAERPREPVVSKPPVKSAAKPVPKPEKATPNTAKTPVAGSKADPKTATTAAPPVAGSGRKTGKGTDVTNMVADGIEFPYPGYLDNIVRQIHLNFSWTKGGAYIAELKFLIHRDGSVSDIEVVTPSGNREFDREGRGSIEAAGSSRAFHPLPSGFPDDVLPVFFTFAPDKNNMEP